MPLLKNQLIFNFAFLGKIYLQLEILSGETWENSCGICVGLILSLRVKIPKAVVKKSAKV
jgi:hypothetical protein